MRKTVTIGDLGTIITGKTPPTVKIQTRSKSTLKTAEDVDKYLAGLRKQIMPYIDKGDEIIIL